MCGFSIKEHRVNRIGIIDGETYHTCAWGVFDASSVQSRNQPHLRMKSHNTKRKKKAQCQKSRSAKAQARDQKLFYIYTSTNVGLERAPDSHSEPKKGVRQIKRPQRNRRITYYPSAPLRKKRKKEGKRRKEKERKKERSEAKIARLPMADRAGISIYESKHL